MNKIIANKSIENKLIQYQNKFVLIDSDVAQLYQVETKRINEAVKNNPDKFPTGYILDIEKDDWKLLKSKFSTSIKGGKIKLPRAFTEKGLYMLATILKSKIATQTTIQIIETFSNVKELSKNINMLTKSQDEDTQNKLAKNTSRLLEEIIEIEDDLLNNDGEVVETHTKFEFNLGFAKIVKSIKKIKS